MGQVDGDRLHAEGGGRVGPSIRARLAIWGVVLIWAANFSFIKVGLEDVPPFAFNALRFPLASAALLAFWGAARPVTRRRGTGSGGAAGPAGDPGARSFLGFDRRHWPALLGLGVLGHVAYQPFFIVGLDNTLAGNSSLILAAVPVFVALLSVALGHERLGTTTWIGVALSFLGIALVVRGGARAVGFGGATVLGDLLTIGAAVVWSSYTVASVPLVRRYGALPVTAITMWIGTVGIVAMGVPALVELDWGAVRPAAWVAVVYAGALGVGIAYLLWYTSVDAIGSTRTAVYSNVVPIATLAIAWPALGEVPTWLQLAGAAAILGGVTLARAAAPAPAEEIPVEE